MGLTPRELRTWLKGARQREKMMSFPSYVIASKVHNANSTTPVSPFEMAGIPEPEQEVSTHGDPRDVLRRVREREQILQDAEIESSFQGWPDDSEDLAHAVISYCNDQGEES